MYNGHRSASLSKYDSHSCLLSVVSGRVCEGEVENAIEYTFKLKRPIVNLGDARDFVEVFIMLFKGTSRKKTQQCSACMV